MRLGERFEYTLSASQDQVPPLIAAPTYRVRFEFTSITCP
jgi:hypothetical protein